MLPHRKKRKTSVLAGAVIALKETFIFKKLRAIRFAESLVDVKGKIGHDGSDLTFFRLQFFKA